MATVNDSYLTKLYPKASDFKCSQGTSCFKIDINESVFTHIPYMMTLMTETTAANQMVSDKTGIRF